MKKHLTKNKKLILSVLGSLVVGASVAAVAAACASEVYKVSKLTIKNNKQLVLELSRALSENVLLQMKQPNYKFVITAIDASGSSKLVLNTTGNLAVYDKENKTLTFDIQQNNYLPKDGETIVFHSNKINGSFKYNGEKTNDAPSNETPSTPITPEPNPDKPAPQPDPQDPTKVSATSFAFDNTTSTLSFMLSKEVETTSKVRVIVGKLDANNQMQEDGVKTLEFNPTTKSKSLSFVLSGLDANSKYQLRNVNVDDEQVSLPQQAFTFNTKASVQPNPGETTPDTQKEQQVSAVSVDTQQQNPMVSLTFVNDVLANQEVTIKVNKYKDNNSTELSKYHEKEEKVTVNSTTKTVVLNQFRGLLAGSKYKVIAVLIGDKSITLPTSGLDFTTKATSPKLGPATSIFPSRDVPAAPKLLSITNTATQDQNPKVTLTFDKDVVSGTKVSVKTVKQNTTASAADTTPTTTSSANLPHEKVNDVVVSSNSKTVEVTLYGLLAGSTYKITEVKLNENTVTLPADSTSSSNQTFTTKQTTVTYTPHFLGTYP